MMTGITERIIIEVTKEMAVTEMIMEGVTMITGIDSVFIILKAASSLERLFNFV